MASVVFLRGVNVGGHKAFQPSMLVEALPELDIVNVGAAGTFVVRKNIGRKALHAALIRKLPFDAELIICPSNEILALTFAKAADHEIKRYVSILTDKPRTTPPLPILHPDGDDWQVKVLAVTGRFVLSLHRRLNRTLLYPNAVVEKRFGAVATTRNWNTIETIRKVLEGDE